MRFEGIAVTGDRLDVEGQVHRPTEIRSPAMTQEEYLRAVEQMRPDLIKAAEHNCYAPDDAEDAVQEGILYCLRKLEQYDSTRASLKTWVTTAVIDRALNTNYHHSRQQVLVKPHPGFLDDTEHTENTRRAQTKPKQAEESGYDPNLDLRLSVQQALAKLPDKERKAAVAIYIEGYSIDEYAEQIGVSSATVDRLLAGARDKLRRVLKEWRD
jgi:RNA polymerase sigma-70 factor (ECF subfamily)